MAKKINVVRSNATFCDWLPMKPDRTGPTDSKKACPGSASVSRRRSRRALDSARTGGEVAVISSSVQPDHPGWAGKMKGWPVRSLEFQRAIHDRAIKQASSAVDMYVSLLNQLTTDNKHALEAWNSDKLYQPGTLRVYKGHEDPAFRTTLKKNHESELADARTDLANKKVTRP